MAGVRIQYFGLFPEEILGSFAWQIYQNAGRFDPKTLGQVMKSCILHDLDLECQQGQENILIALL